MILLYCIVSQVYKFIVQIFHVKLFRSSSNVTILKPVAFLMTINTSKTDIASNIKLSFLIKERHNVLLYNMSSWSPQSVNFFSFYLLLDLFNTFHNFNSVSSICILSGFYKPCISFLRFISILQLLSFLFFLLFLDILCSSFILLRKTKKFFIIDISNMKSHRNKIKRIDFLCFIITFQIHEECFFI